MRYTLATLALAALLGAPLTATAIPITYQIKFTALAGSVSTRVFPDPIGPGTTHFEDAAGTVYFGLFAVDDSILATDGLNKPGSVEFFSIQMEDNIWAYNLAGNNSFVGFRGPGGLGAASPGFDVVNGTITNLRGGVFGIADVPFVDFSLFGPNTFNARGAPSAPFIPGTTVSYVGTAFETVTGTMEIFRVREPGTLMLLAFGLLVLAVVIGRARRQR
jgi:hypothetical protein